MTLDDAHALVIGIARYQHVPTLRETPDAQDVAAVLQDPACCGYPAAGVRVLLDAAATRAAIFEALDALARDTREASTVFIYFSGHGAQAAQPGAYYVIPVDGEAATSADLARTAIGNRELSARLAAIPAGRLTVVLDCCHAADLATPRLADAITPLAQGRGRVVLAASRAAGMAYAMPGQHNSLLTGALVAGLRGAATGVGGVIRICDLFDYVQHQIAASPQDQHPVFKAELEENYPVARLRGGAFEPLALPPPSGDFAYDAFISYCRDDPADHAWVTGVLVPALEGLGLELYLAWRDSPLGMTLVEAAGDAVTRSRYTVAVLTPAYLAAAYGELELALAKHVALASHAPRFVPLMRRPCALALDDQMTAVLDASEDSEVAATFARLALALRQPGRPRLTT